MIEGPTAFSTTDKTSMSSLSRRSSSNAGQVARFNHRRTMSFATRRFTSPYQQPNEILFSLRPGMGNLEISCLVYNSVTHAFAGFVMSSYRTPSIRSSNNASKAEMKHRKSSTCAKRTSDKRRLVTCAKVLTSTARRPKL